MLSRRPCALRAAKSNSIPLLPPPFPASTARRTATPNAKSILDAMLAEERVWQWLFHVHTFQVELPAIQAVKNSLPIGQLDTHPLVWTRLVVTSDHLAE
jgi:hypothetical protein